MSLSTRRINLLVSDKTKIQDCKQMDDNKVLKVYLLNAEFQIFVSAASTKTITETTMKDYLYIKLKYIKNCIKQKVRSTNKVRKDLESGMQT